MKIALGSDHVGYPLKLRMVDYLKEKGHFCTDLGTYDEERTDYPIYGARVAHAVASGEYEVGILVCGTGVGMAITANKIAGIRAVVCSEPYSARLAREHNDANILAFGSRVVDITVAEVIADAFLTAEFEGGRHIARLNMISELEK